MIRSRCKIKKDITYRVVIDVFDGEVIIRDKDRLLEEADRLFGYGYTCAVETLIV